MHASELCYTPTNKIGRVKIEERRAAIEEAVSEEIRRQTFLKECFLYCRPRVKKTWNGVDPASMYRLLEEMLKSKSEERAKQIVEEEERQKGTIKDLTKRKNKLMNTERKLRKELGISLEIQITQTFSSDNCLLQSCNPVLFDLSRPKIKMQCAAQVLRLNPILTYEIVFSVVRLPPDDFPNYYEKIKKEIEKTTQCIEHFVDVMAKKEFIYMALIAYIKNEDDSLKKFEIKTSGKITHSVHAIISERTHLYNSRILLREYIARIMMMSIVDEISICMPLIDLKRDHFKYFEDRYTVSRNCYTKERYRIKRERKRERLQEKSQLK